MFKAEEWNVKGLWQKVKEIWWDFWEVDVNDKAEERLSSSDRRWLLYWNFITCMGVAALIVIVEEEREQARQEYLDRCGVPQSYRWTTPPWEL